MDTQTLRYQKVTKIAHEINQDLSTIPALVQKLSRLASDVLDVRHFLMLAVHRPQTGDLKLHWMLDGVYGDAPAPMAGYCQQVITQQAERFVPELSKANDAIPIVNLRETTTRSECLLFVPLTLREIPLGVLSIQHVEPNAYTDEDREILRLLARHVTLAVNSIQLLDNLVELNRTSQFLMQQLDSPEILQHVADRIKEATKADLVTVYTYLEDNSTFELPPTVSGELLQPGVTQPTNSPSHSLAMWTVQQQAPVFETNSSRLYARFKRNPEVRQNFIERERVQSTAAVPLWVGNETVGALFVNFRQPQYFNEPQRQLIHGLASFAAIAIQNSHEFAGQKNHRVQELEILRQIDQEIIRSLNLEQLLRKVLDLLARHIAVDETCAEASIFLYNPQEHNLETRATWGSNEDVRRARTVELAGDRGITRWVFENKQPVRVDNVHTDPEWRERYIEFSAAIRSELAVPLRQGNDVIGVINFECTTEAAFSHVNLDFLDALAGQTSVAIRNFQEYQALKNIIAQLDTKDIFNSILQEVLKLTNSDAGTLMLYDHQRDDLRMAAQKGVTEDKIGGRHKLTEGIVGYAALTKQLVNVPDVDAEEWKERHLPFIPGVRSELAVPVLKDDELLGVINVESTAANHFSDRDERSLTTFASLLVTSIQLAERFAQAEDERARFEDLYGVGQRLSQITDVQQLEEAYTIIFEVARQRTPGRIVLRRLDERGQDLRVVRTAQIRTAPPTEFMPLGEGWNGWVAKKGTTLRINDVDHLPSGVPHSPFAAPEVKSYLIVPITLENEFLYGTLTLSHEQTHFFTDDTVKLFEGLAQQLAITIHRLEMVQKQREAERRANAAELFSLLGQETGGLTHRLGSDLGRVRANVNRVRRGLRASAPGMPASIETDLNEIVRDVERVLTLSKELKGAFGELNPAKQDRSNFLVAIALQEAIEAAKLPETIAVDASDIPPLLTAHGNRRQILVILNHLLINAKEAMTSGGKITVSCKETDGYVIITMSDTGGGIREEFQKRIFEPFFTTKKDGSGIGLWSARICAEANDGQLNVHSELGQGTTFTLTLPGEKDQTENAH